MRRPWAYHLVNGWYITTSSKHYRTHTCHVKLTRSKRLMDTAQFKHKNITNPTGTHAEKLIKAIADCANQGIANWQQRHPYATQLEKLEEIIWEDIKQNPSIAKVSPIVDTVPLPRMPLSMNDDTPQQTRSATRQSQQLPRVDTQSVPKVDSAPPANNHLPIISSRKCAKQKSSAPHCSFSRYSSKQHESKEGISNGRKTMATKVPRVVRLSRPLTSSKGNTRPGRASAVEERQGNRCLWRLTQRLTRMENEVHR